MTDAEVIQGLFIMLIILIAIVAAIGWMLVISSGYKLDAANKVGKAKESNCGEFYLEGESARASIYDAYRGEGGIEQRLSVVFQIFYYSLYILMLLLGGYFTFYGIINKQSIEGWEWVWIGFSILGLIGVFIAWNIMYFKSNDQTINPFQDALYKFGTDNKVNEDTKKDIIGRQAGLLGGFAIVLAGMTYTFIEYKKINALDANTLRYIWMIFIVVAIFVLYITNEIYGLTANIRLNYQTKSGEINALLKTALSNNTPALENNLRNNIQALDRLAELPPPGLHTNGTYQEKLYRYVMNAVNMAETRNVSLPEALTDIIDPQYLRGEKVIAMKNDFLIYHNGPTLGNFNSYVKKYLKADYSRVANAPSNAQTTEPWNACAGSGGDKTNCEKVKALTQRYIVENDTYNMTKTVPTNVRNKLLALRGDLSIVGAAHNFYKHVNVISVVVFLIMSYILFHRLYEQNPSMAQIIALIMIVIVMLVGFVGWFFKDLWL